MVLKILRKHSRFPRRIMYSFIVLSGRKIKDNCSVLREYGDFIVVKGHFI